MKKLLFLIFIVVVIAPCFSVTFNPDGKEEFCFIPLYYDIDWNTVGFTAHYEESYLYNDFYSDIDSAINGWNSDNKRKYYSAKSGLWYWDYVLTRGYFDYQILNDSTGAKIEDSKYDYYSVVLEDGSSYVYKCIKGRKYTPAGRGLFVIQPIDKYKPILEKAPFVPGSWVTVVGCDGIGDELLSYRLSNGNSIDCTILERMIDATNHIEKDSARLKLAELVTNLEYPSVSYDEGNSVVWIDMCNLEVAKALEYPMINYIGYITDGSYLLPRLMFLFEDEDINSIVIRYDGVEWDAYEALNPTFKPTGKNYYYCDCWIGDYLSTLEKIITAKDVQIRYKTGEQYKTLTITEKNKTQMKYLFQIYDSFN